MGTSTNYDGSSNWKSTKSEITQAGGEGLITPEKASSIVNGLIDQMVDEPQLGFGDPLVLPTPPTEIDVPRPEPTSGVDVSTQSLRSGVRRVSTGTGRGGSGGGGGGRARGGGSGSSSGGSRVSTRIGGSARIVAQGIGGFLSDVANRGFREALAERGLTDISGKSADEVALALADILGGSSSLIEETALRDALMALVLAWSVNAQSLEGLAQATNAAAQNIEGTLHRFFGHYIFEVFKTVGYQGVLQKHGFEKAESLTNQIRDFINAKISSIRSSRSLTSIDWNGPGGAAIIDEVVKSTQDVFGEAES